MKKVNKEINHLQGLKKWQASATAKTNRIKESLLSSSFLTKTQVYNINDVFIMQYSKITDLMQ